MTEERRARVERQIERIKISLDKYYEAEIAVCDGGQQYSLGSRSLTRANLGEIRAAILDLENRLDRLQSELNGRGRNRMVGVIPLDI